MLPWPLLLLAAYDLFVGVIALGLPGVLAWRMVNKGDPVTGLALTLGAYGLVSAGVHIAAGVLLLKRSLTGWRLALAIQLFDVVNNLAKVASGTPAVVSNSPEATPVRYLGRALIAAAWAAWLLRPEVRDEAAHR